MKKYTLLRDRIIDGFYFEEISSNDAFTRGIYRDKEICITYNDIIKTSDDILDLIGKDDLIGVTKEGTDFGDLNICEACIQVLDLNLLNEWRKQKLNIISIYKRDPNDNFIRVAKKIHGKWRIK